TRGVELLGPQLGLAAEEAPRRRAVVAGGRDRGRERLERVDVLERREEADRHGLVRGVAAAVVEVDDLLGGHDDVVPRGERVGTDGPAAPRRDDDVARERGPERLVPDDGAPAAGRDVLRE